MSAELFDSIVTRPAIYFGNREGYLRELVAMDFGYSLHSGFDETGMSHNDSLIPPPFVQFVCSRYEPDPVRGPSWSARIEGQSIDEHDAWRLFCALWEQFRGGQLVE
jgi:hypothetical protein